MYKKLIYILMISSVLGNESESPQFGERIRKNNNSDIIENVFRPFSLQNTKNETKYRIKAFPSQQKTTDKLIGKQRDVNHLNDTKLIFFEEKPIENKETEILFKSIERDQRKINEFASEMRPFQMDVHNLLNVPELAETEFIRGPPIPPPPPNPLKLLKEMNGIKRTENINNDKKKSAQNEGIYKSIKSIPLETQFSTNIRRTFPLKSGTINGDSEQMADFKKEQMGAENNEGQPWGTKTSYTYRDPKNPHNFMEMSQVTMTINRQMNPKEAQSQIQRFLVAAQNGQYGPLSSAAEQNKNGEYNDDSYESDSHLVPSEPIEPIEPNFPNF